MFFNVSSLFYVCRLYGFQSSLSWESAFYQDMKSKNDKVGGYWILDFIEIRISLWCAWLNFEQFSGHITCNFKCTSLHWHCKWIEWKSSLTFVEWCVWTGICIYRVYILCLLIRPWGPLRSHWDWLFIDPQIICNPGWAFNLLPMCEIDFITLSSLRSSQKHDVS